MCPYACQLIKMATELIRYRLVRTHEYDEPDRNNSHFQGPNTGLLVHIHPMLPQRTWAVWRMATPRRHLAFVSLQLDTRPHIYYPTWRHFQRLMIFLPRLASASCLTCLKLSICWFRFTIVTTSTPAVTKCLPMFPSPPLNLQRTLSSSSNHGNNTQTPSTVTLRKGSWLWGDAISCDCRRMQRRKEY